MSKQSKSILLPTSNRPLLHFLQCERYPVLDQLLLEETLLRTTTQNWCLINRGSSPAIVFGISGRINDHLSAPSPFPLIRRYSGGGTVVVDEDTLFVSLIFQKADGPSPCYPEPVLRWSAHLYQEAFALPGFALKENDYVIGSRKCGGNAQYFQKHRFVHHTTFLWDYTTNRMNTLLFPPKTPAYRQDRPHDAFLCRLKDYFPSQNLLIDSILSTLSRFYTLKKHSSLPTLAPSCRLSTRIIEQSLK